MSFFSLSMMPSMRSLNEHDCANSSNVATTSSVYISTAGIYYRYAVSETVVIISGILINSVTENSDNLYDL